MDPENLESHAKKWPLLIKCIKTIQEEKITRAVSVSHCCTVVIHKVYTSLGRQTHTFTSLDSNAVVLQGKVHRFSSNRVVSHEECQPNKPKNNHHGNTFSMT